MGKHKTKRSKIFVLDTNIILHDHNAIKKFQENDIVIPMAVLEELDKFKKGFDSININARGFMREIDHLTDSKLFGEKGVKLGENLGYINIVANHPFSKNLEKLFKDDIQDHRILSTAIWIRDSNPDKYVALVTKDINLRMKAKACGMIAEDYKSDRIEDEKIEKQQQDIEWIRDCSEDDLLLLQEKGIEANKLLQGTIKANQLFIFERKNKSLVYAKYNIKAGLIEQEKEKYAYGIRPRNHEQMFALNACLDKDIQLVSLTGGAGTGKTLIALAAAIEQANEYDQIILTRPTVILGNQDIGFLPGNEKSKMTPFVQPLMDNIQVIKSQFKKGSKDANKIESMLKEEKILISPLAYIRGRSLGNVFYIIDEAQNLSPHEIKTIITRAGKHTKMVFTGDINQIDQPYLDKWSNGLTHLYEKMSGQALFQHVDLKKGVRSPLSEIASRLL